jgi:hypothetical protein
MNFSTTCFVERTMDKRQCSRLLYRLINVAEGILIIRLPIYEIVKTASAAADTLVLTIFTTKACRRKKLPCA